MIKKSAKIERYIIVIALLLSFVILGGFWFRNRDVSSSSALNLPSSESTPQLGNDKKIDSASTEPETVPRHGLSKILEPGKLNAIVLGDSIAESQGTSNKDQSSWYSNVAKGLQSRYPGTIEWSFIAGEKLIVKDILTRVPEIGTDSDVVMICLGRNDSSQLKLEEFKQKYQQLITEIQSTIPHADIYLIVEPPVKDIPKNNRFFPYRQAIVELGKAQQLPVIDTWLTFINDPAPLSSLILDGVNPNDTGYRIFADTVLKRFDEYLIPKS